MGLFLLLVLQRALKSVVTHLVELVVGKQVDGVELLFQIVAIDPLVEGSLMRPRPFLHSLFLWFREELLHPVLEPILMEVLD